MSPTASWPPLDYDALAPTLDHLHRLALVGGKHTVDTPFEPNWGNVPLNITPRGFATPTVHAGDIAFLVDYDLLDHRVELVASTGRRTLHLGPGSVADFLDRFTEASAALRVPALSNLSEPELADAPTLDADVERRPYDPDAAALIAEVPRCAGARSTSTRRRSGATVTASASCGEASTSPLNVSTAATCDPRPPRRCSCRTA